MIVSGTEKRFFDTFSPDATCQYALWDKWQSRDFRCSGKMKLWVTVCRIRILINKIFCTHVLDSQLFELHGHYMMTAKSISFAKVMTANADCYWSARHFWIFSCKVACAADDRTTCLVACYPSDRRPSWVAHFVGAVCILTWSVLCRCMFQYRTVWAMVLSKLMAAYLF